MKRFAVILSGSGVFDGAEIHEAVFTLLAIAKHGAEYKIFAPNIEQYHVINHLNGEVMDETRNVLVESARIARGNISSLSDFDQENFDAIIFPGGFGVAKSLCTFAFDSANCTVDQLIETTIKSMYSANKPIGALCVSPALIAKVLGNIDVTIGHDIGTANEIEKMGAHHINTNQTGIIVDKKNKIVSSPCYMLESNIVQIAEGADNVVKAILDLLN
ncbi:MAG: isoprenoid biosynthesis glyoxalase ElbB [Bacteroidota bacterium]